MGSLVQSPMGAQSVNTTMGAQGGTTPNGIENSSTPGHPRTTDDPDYYIDIAEYYDEVLDSLRNASANINCSLTNIWDWNVTGLVYMGDEPPQTLAELTIADVVKIVAYAFISLFGLVGNVLVIFLVLKNRPLRTTINYYLINLAVADIIISLFCVWIHLIDSVSRAPWVLGAFTCKISGFLQMTALTSSTMSLTVISADRFLAVIYPLQVRAMQRNCRKVVLSIWTLAIAVSIPFILFREMITMKWKTYEENICVDTWPQRILYNSNGTCYFDHYWKRMYYTSVSAALFFLPCCVMSVNYTFIGAKIWMSEIPGDAESVGPLPPANAHRRGTKYKVLKMVIIVMVVYCACWTPLQFINLYAMWAHDVHTDGSLKGWFDIATFVAYTMAYANSAVNPILYGGLNSAFRTSAMQVFSWLGDCRRGRAFRGFSSHGRNTPMSSQTRQNRQVLRVNFRRYESQGHLVPPTGGHHGHPTYTTPAAGDTQPHSTVAMSNGHDNKRINSGVEVATISLQNGHQMASSRRSGENKTRLNNGVQEDNQTESCVTVTGHSTRRSVQLSNRRRLPHFDKDNRDYRQAGRNSH